MGKYKKPRRVNTVTILVVLGALVLGYGLWKFGPPYYRKWRVKRILDDAVNSLYSKRQVDDMGDLLEKLREATRKKIREAGVVDASLRLHLKKDRQAATISAEYHEVIAHPFVKRPTKLYFHPSARLDFE